MCGRAMHTYMYSYMCVHLHMHYALAYMCLLRHMCLFVHTYVHFQSCKFAHHVCIDAHVYVFSRYAYLHPHVCLLSTYMHTNICVCIHVYIPRWPGNRVPMLFLLSPLLYLPTVDLMIVPPILRARLPLLVNSLYKHPMNCLSPKHARFNQVDS